MPALDLSGRLARHLGLTGMFDESGLALLAVSGGPDSVALLDLMVGLAPALGIELAVAHVDHGIRPGSATVAADVVALAERFGLSAHVATIQLGPEATETEARRERYRALRAFQRRLGATYLVTAHHADDQVETVLYRVLRGSGTAGLSGIPAAGTDGLVRPLLPFTEADLRSWLDSRAESHDVLARIHHDPANTDERHDRSWLRARLLPLLRNRFGPEVDRRLLDTARQAAASRVAWSQVLCSWPALEFASSQHGVEVARSPFGRYDNVLCGELLRALAREVGCVVGPKRATSLLRFVRSGSSGRVMQLGGGWEAELVFDRLRILRADPTGAGSCADTSAWGCTRTGRFQWDRWEFAWRLEPAGVPVRGALATWVTRGAGEVRALQSGDRIFPLGGVGRRKVRRVMMEARVRSRDRESYPVVVRNGEVVWIPGICRSARFVPSPGEPALRLEARARGRPQYDAR